MASLRRIILLAMITAGSIWIWFDVLQDDDDNESSIDRRPVLEMAEAATTEVSAEIIEEVEILEEEEETPEEVETSLEEIAEKFFYNQLDDRQQVIYREIRNGVAHGYEEIRVDTDNAEEVSDIYRLVLFDHPEFFWVTNAGLATVFTWTDGRSYTIFEPDYIHTGAAKEAMQVEIEAAVDAFLASIDPGLTEYELVRAVYEYIIMTTTYNEESSDNQNIYSVFVNRESVCAGFSKAAQLLLSRLGIFATYVTGVAYVPGVSSAPIPHAWNLVRVYGEYYYLDVTWGSPAFQEGSGLADRIDILYDYLLLNEEKLFRTHTLAEGLVMPPVTSLYHNFFVMNDMFYETHDPGQVLEAMNASILNREDWVAFQFATPELFQAMRPIIIEELAPEAARNLAYWYGLGSVQYFIREKENLNKITLYWVYE